MIPTYQTQDVRRRRYVWRCYRCRRIIAFIDRMDGVIEVKHKCGAVNTLAGELPGALPDFDTGDEML